MKQTLKKLLMVVLALIVVFAYTKITGTDGSSTMESAQSSSDLMILPESDNSSPEVPAEPAVEPEAPAENEEDADGSKESVKEEPSPSETQPEEKDAEPEELPATKEPAVDKNGIYTTKEDVALYIHTYGKLPSNFITKKEAEKAGWPGGSLEPYCPGKCIGGSHFGNYEGLLPDKKGRSWTECDIDTLGAKSRGAKRIIFSNDGLIYYTDDHYESFELLYGEP